MVNWAKTSYCHTLYGPVSCSKKQGVGQLDEKRQNGSGCSDQIHRPAAMISSLPDCSNYTFSSRCVFEKVLID